MRKVKGSTDKISKFMTFKIVNLQEKVQFSEQKS